MELIDSIRQIAKVYTERKDIIQTEEATKTALIMPLITALGYNVFDPTEVVPEFTADIGIKKGEKVDYAIIKDGKPIMLIEAKWSGEELDVSKESQLMRYFNTTPAKIGILTNGHEYRFYTDLDQDNIMDMMPFLQFSICDISEQIVRELKRFTKGAFKIEEIASTASELKYTGTMKPHPRKHSRNSRAKSLPLRTKLTATMRKVQGHNEESVCAVHQRPCKRQAGLRIVRGKSRQYSIRAAGSLIPRSTAGIQEQNRYHPGRN